MMEVFAKPAVGAIIEKGYDDEKYILIQERNKTNDVMEKGMIEIPAGKVREYENIFEALRREIWEETGLTITQIEGEENLTISENSGYKTIGFIPFCSTQNLSGGYSIMLQTFICQAEGDLLEETNETVNIRWEAIDIIERMLENNPEQFYPMHINALRKYFLLRKVKDT